MCILYVLSYLDRGNMGNAKTAGAQDDLGLDSSQWTWVLNAFYIAYVLMEWVTSQSLSGIVETDIAPDHNPLEDIPRSHLRCDTLPTLGHRCHVFRCSDQAESPNCMSCVPWYI